MKKKIILLNVLIFFVLLPAMLIVSACADYETMYNDDAAIIKSSGYSAKMMVRNKTNDSLKLKVDEISGVFVVDNNFDFTANSSITFNNQLSSGKMKLVLTNSESVYVLAEGSYNGAVTFTGVPYGEYDIKLVAYQAKAELTVTYTE